MAYNTKSIVKDVNGKPIPQYFNTTSDNYEVIQSDNGLLKVILTDKLGNEVVSQNLTNQIVNKLDELIQAVK